MGGGLTEKEKFLEPPWFQELFVDISAWRTEGRGGRHYSPHCHL